MIATTRLPKRSITPAVCGAFAGWWATAVVRPSLRAIDPTGCSPMILVFLLGGWCSSGTSVGVLNEGKSLVGTLPDYFCGT